MGSAALAMLLGADVGRWWVALLGIGFCGAYTTFSTFALELWDAVRERRTPALVANLAFGLGAFTVAFLIADGLAG